MLTITTRWLLIVTISVILTACGESTVSPPQDKSLHPWLSESGTFGYVNDQGRMVIPPQYDNAGRFHNGYAVVAQNEEYGVINSDGKVVIPLEYAFVRLFIDNQVTLAITKEEYNAWWEFWHWRILPEWNILFSDFEGPLLVTEVPKAQWSIRALPGKEILFKDQRMDTGPYSRYWEDSWEPKRTLPSDIHIRAAGRLVSIKGKTFRLDDRGVWTPIQGRLITTKNADTLLMRTHNAYYLADKTGKRINTTTYTAATGLRFKTSSGKKIFVPKESESGYHRSIISGPLLQNAQGEFFISGDLSKAFPTRIENYQRAGVTLLAKDILGHAVGITSLAGTNYFVIFSAAGMDAGYRLFLLDEKGHWYTGIPAYKGVDRMLSDGRIIFDRAALKGVLYPDLRFYDMPITYIRPVTGHPYWYMGKVPKTDKFGVYDAKHQKWQVAPEYNYLPYETAPGVAVYTVIKEDAGGNMNEKYGLINIETDKRLTPPVYNRIRSNGRVVRTIDGERLSYYINVNTGEEYRSKN